MSPQHTNKNQSDRNNNGPAQQPNNSTTQLNTGSIIDSIHEKATNIEIATIQANKRAAFERGIKALGIRERSLRESTLTITHAGKAEEIMSEIELKWVEKHQKEPVTYWQDKEKLYVQFKSEKTKFDFLQLHTNNDQPLITTKGHIVDPADPSTTQHFTRKPIKCLIDNLRPTITSNRIGQIIASSVKGTNIAISPILEGKPHANTKHRAILFRMNGKALSTLLNQYNGELQYNHLEMKIKQKLNFKINCRPWQCKDCFTFGRHDCKGRKCANCGNPNHSTQDCVSKRRYCPNCKKPGHKARDSHCESYLAEVFKELRKIDVPLEFLENKEKRAKLITHILY